MSKHVIPYSDIRFEVDGTDVIGVFEGVDVLAMDISGVDLDNADGYEVSDISGDYLYFSAVGSASIDISYMDVQDSDEFPGLRHGDEADGESVLVWEDEDAQDAKFPVGTVVIADYAKYALTSPPEGSPDSQLIVAVIAMSEKSLCGHEEVLLTPLFKDGWRGWVGEATPGLAHAPCTPKTFWWSTTERLTKVGTVGQYAITAVTL